MSEQVVSLTNRKKIPMSLPNGEGGVINLAPGETRMIRGDLEHYRRMPAQGMNGLVVRLVEGKSRLVEAEKRIENDVRLVTVTNHRNIPMQLATGVGQKKVDIGPKSTSEPFLGRVSTIKQMSGITVKAVEEAVEDPGRDPGKAETSSPDKGDETKVEDAGEAGAADAEARAKQAADDELRKKDAAAVAEVEAKAKQAAEDEARRKKEAEANDPLAIRRRDLALPATAEEWAVHKEQLTWPDVRGLCKQLDIKTGSMDKKGLLEAITEKLYPKG